MGVRPAGRIWPEGACRSVRTCASSWVRCGKEVGRSRRSARTGGDADFSRAPQAVAKSPRARARGPRPGVAPERDPIRGSLRSAFNGRHRWGRIDHCRPRDDVSTVTTTHSIASVLGWTKFIIDKELIHTTVDAGKRSSAEHLGLAKSSLQGTFRQAIHPGGRPWSFRRHTRSPGARTRAVHPLDARRGTCSRGDPGRRSRGARSFARQPARRHLFRSPQRAWSVVGGRSRDGAVRSRSDCSSWRVGGGCCSTRPARVQHRPPPARFRHAAGYQWSAVRGHTGASRSSRRRKRSGPRMSSADRQGRRRPSRSGRLDIRETRS